MPRLLWYPCGSIPGTHWKEGLVGLHSRPGRCFEKKVLPLLRIETQFLGRPSCSHYNVCATSARSPRRLTQVALF
jgi:hypothetical protein